MGPRTRELFFTYFFFRSACHFSADKNNFINEIDFRTKPPHVTPIPRSPMEIRVRTVCEQHLTLRGGDHEPSTNTDEGVRDKPEASRLGEDVERGN